MQAIDACQHHLPAFDFLVWLLRNELYRVWAIEQQCLRLLEHRHVSHNVDLVVAITDADEHTDSPVTLGIVALLALPDISRLIKTLKHKAVRARAMRVSWVSLQKLREIAEGAPPSVAPSKSSKEPQKEQVMGHQSQFTVEGGHSTHKAALRSGFSTFADNVNFQHVH